MGIEILIIPRRERSLPNYPTRPLFMVCYIVQAQKLSGNTLSADFFEESDEYWVPANETSKIYEQMAAKKYREIPRHQIQ